MTHDFKDVGRLPTARPGKFPRFIRLGALLASASLLGACVDGGSSPPKTSVENTPPVATAGPDQTVFTQGLVTLNGVGSTDADDDALAYTWEFVSRPGGSTTGLESIPTQQGQEPQDRDGVRTYESNVAFTPDVVGTYVIRVTVDDGFPGSSSTDTVAVIAGSPPPVANAGADQNLSFAGSDITVQLNGGASSDPSSLPLTYAWVIQSFVPASGLPPAVSPSLVGAGTVNPSFTVTDADQLGIYTLALTVNNGTQDASDTVRVTIASIPAPIANAGPDQEVTFVVSGTTVSLDGTGSSDPSSLPLSYSWEILSFQSTSGNPPAQGALLVGASTATPTFDINALDQLGTYTLQLTVSNGTLAATDQVVVTVAKSFPAAGALLGGSLFAAAGAALRRRWRRQPSTTGAQ